MLPDQSREGDEYNTLRGNKSAVSLDRFEPPGTLLVVLFSKKLTRLICLV